MLLTLGKVRLIRDNQQGFVDGKSSLTNLIEVIRKIECRAANIVSMNLAQPLTKYCMVSCSVRLDCMRSRAS